MRASFRPVATGTASEPTDPIAAVTHPDPYPYYRRLATGGPIQFDQRLGLWVVSGHAAIGAVLTSPAMRTRPVAERVPAGLVGTATGDVFARLVRMTDGARSQEVRNALRVALAMVPPEDAWRLADETAVRVFARAIASGDPDWPTGMLFALPVTVMGALLGLSGPALDGLTELVRPFAAAIAPAPFTGSASVGNRAIHDLAGQIGALLDPSPGRTPRLLGAFVQQAEAAGAAERATIVANAIGLLFQSLDATAGLIGNTLRALASRPNLLAMVTAEPDRLARIIDETLRHDPPVQNTRRFFAETTTVAGQVIEAGATLLLLLASANRDPAAFSDPDLFDPNRDNSQTALTFGLGPHRCPGQQLARSIALAGITHGIRHDLADPRVFATPRFVPSPNARVPILTAPEPQAAYHLGYPGRTP